MASEARKTLEKFFGKSIFIEIYVKVDKDWRNNSKRLEAYGYKLD